MTSQQPAEIAADISLIFLGEKQGQMSTASAFSQSGVVRYNF